VSSRRQVQANRDIREWARANGRDLGERGPIPPDIREDYYARDGAPDGAEPGDGEQLPDGTDGADAGLLDRIQRSITDAPEPGDTGEIAPVPPPRRSLWRSRAGAGTGRRRESLERMATFAWGGLAQAAARSGRIPTSRMLSLQAPIAGELLDDVLKGTILDRLLQPLARTGAKGEAVFALVGPVILVEMIAANPARQDQLMPLLIMALEGYAEMAGPKLKAAAKRREKRVQDIGQNGIAEMIQMLFAPPEGMAPDGAVAA